jgi:hypothetical protein
MKVCVMCEDEMEDVLMEWKMCFVSVSAKLPEKWLCSADLLPKRNTSSVWQIFRRFVVREEKKQCTDFTTDHIHQGFPYASGVYNIISTSFRKN